MISVGIEAMNVFGGSAYMDVMELARHRKLDNNRFANLLMKEKAVALPCEDPITYAVNAAKPLVDALSHEEKERIEMVITCTESGIDFGKSISTYIHYYLKLNKNCRLFELKQACYSGTAGFQNAVNFILSQTSPGAKALVISTDISRFMINEGEDVMNEAWVFAEPSAGAGAVAMLISDQPNIFQLDIGASGYYGYEVMDTCRPVPDSEAGNADLSLMSYLDCCENAFLEYKKRVKDVDYGDTFHYLAFHTPFGGMVKGAHRNMTRKILKATPEQIEEDFTRRVLPGMLYCQRVGNIMGGTIFLSLASTIDNGSFETAKRIGCFSYGSGCCSEFYSGIVSSQAKEQLQQLELEKQLDARYRLTFDEYEALLRSSNAVRFGTKNTKLEIGTMPGATAVKQGKKRLILSEINEFHREYSWLE